MVTNLAPRLTKPYRGANILQVSQGFHSEHKAIDWVNKFGAPCVVPEDVRILGIHDGRSLTDPQPYNDCGFYVDMQGLETGNKYRYCHMWAYSPVWRGDLVKRGHIVGFMGNSGHVLVDNVIVPESTRNAPPHPGSHLHLVGWTPSGSLFDTLAVTDLETEPAYTTADYLVAVSKTLSKINTLAFR